MIVSLNRCFLEGGSVKVHYDRETDTLTITLRDQEIREGDEVRPGVVADFGYDGGIVRFEILSASEVVRDPKGVELVVSEAG